MEHSTRKAGRGRWLTSMLAFVLSFSAIAATPLICDDGDILFYRTDGLLRSNTSGSFTAALTRPPAEWRDDRAVWSPDGTHVAFNRTRSDRGRFPGNDATLYVIDRLGRNEKPLFQGAYWPMWSAATNQIAFVYWSGARECFAAIDPGGTGFRHLACADEAIYTNEAMYCEEFHRCEWLSMIDARMSRDGRYIVSEMMIGVTGPSTAHLTFGLWRTDVVTGAHEQIPGTFREHENFNFSVGRSSVWFENVVSTMSGYSSSIHRVPITGGSPVLVTNDGFNPLVSDNESRIAFTRRDGSNHESRLYVANADGTNAQRRTNPVAGVHWVPMDWSADGSRLLLERANWSTGTRSLHLVTTTGSWRTVRSNGGGQRYGWFTPVAGP